MTDSTGLDPVADLQKRLRLLTRRVKVLEDGADLAAQHEAMVEEADPEREDEVGLGELLGVENAEQA